MTTLAEVLMRNRLGALEDKLEYTTADVNGLMPMPSWSSPLAGLGSYQWSQEAGAEPNWFGRNVLANIPPEAMAAANFLIPGAKALPRISNPIRAYHGSPHDFDKFDLSKIGTGEGAQAYGHGLYFAEREGVAKGYRDALSNEVGLIGGKPYDEKDPAHIASAWLNSWGPGAGDRAKVIAELRRQYDLHKPYEGGYAQRLLRAVGILERGEPLLPYESNPGRMYEVALHATPEQFLDWDKPLSGQSAAIKEVVGGADKWRVLDPSGMHRGGVYSRQDAERLASNHAGFKAEPFPNLTGGDVIGAYGAGGEGVASKLREAGIPGIRYLDQGSRGRPVPRQTPELTAIEQKMDAAWSVAERQSPEALRRLRDSPEWKALEAQKAVALDNATGTRNFVVWSPEIIEILRKYAAPPAIAAPALASVLQQQDN